MSDELRIRDCLAGDEGAWRELVHRYRRLIYSIPFACGLPEATADDVFQTVVVRLWRELRRIRNPAALAAWIATTTRRECYARIRQQRREVALDELPEAEPSPAEAGADERMIRVEREHALALAFERLDESCRALLAAVFLEQPPPSYEELAQRLGRPIGSLGPTRRRCLDKLRLLFLEEGGREP